MINGNPREAQARGGSLLLTQRICNCLIERDWAIFTPADSGGAEKGGKDKYQVIFFCNSALCFFVIHERKESFDHGLTLSCICRKMIMLVILGNDESNDPIHE